MKDLEITNMLADYHKECASADGLADKGKIQLKHARKIKQYLHINDVSGSLHYDEKLLIELWYKRNPCHELNSNSGEDMFWKTAFMVFEDYVRAVSRNDR